MDNDKIAGMDPNPELGGEDMFLNHSKLGQGFGPSARSESSNHRKGQYGPALAHASDPFKPTIITVGPIHCEKRGLRPMNAHKERFLSSILSRGNPRLEDLIKAMKDLEEETRNSYFENFPNISSDAFIKMMVLDGCFIVNLMRLNYGRSQGEHIDDPIFTTRRILPILRRDLLLMENQLPLSVLTLLFQLTSPAVDEPSLKTLALKFFEPLRPDRAAVSPPSDVPDDCKHLLALFQLSCLCSFSPPEDFNPQININSYTHQSIPNIQQLTSSGVWIMKNPKANHLLDIKFKFCMIKIPTLIIDNNSNVVLRNLLAYELSSLDAPTYIASLALFYGSIVKNLQDLKVLQRAQVINKAPLVTEQQVLNLIRSLSKDLSVLQVDDFYLEEQINNIDNYFRTIWCKLYRFRHRLPLITCLKSLLLPRRFISMRKTDLAEGFE